MPFYSNFELLINDNIVATAVQEHLSYFIYNIFLLKWSWSGRGNHKSLSPPASAGLPSAWEEKSIEEARE